MLCHDPLSLRLFLTIDSLIVVVLAAPSANDFILRRLTGADHEKYGVFSIRSQSIVAGPFAALRESYLRAEEMAAAAGGTTWQQASDDRRRPIGRPQRLRVTKSTR